MFDLKRAFVRFILPSTAAVVIVGLAFVFGQTPTISAATGPTWVVASAVGAGPAQEQHVHRYYDRDRKDYHAWTDQEDHAYREWMRDHRRAYRNFGKLNRRDQQEYWQWRHEHPNEVVR